MKVFKSLSIKNKLIVIILIVSLCALAFSSVIYTILEMRHYKEDLKGNILLNIRLVSDYSVPALVFNDTLAASENLATLKSIPYIANCSVYDKNNKLFVSYNRDENKKWESSGTFISGDENFSEESGYWIYSKPVIYKDKRYGTLVVKASTESIYENLNGHLMVSSFVILIVLIFSYFIARRLQSVISGPILSLAQGAKDVYQKEIYSIDSVEKPGDDEIGLLYDEFNFMLKKIELSMQKMEAADKALRLSKQKYMDLIENQGEGIAEVDARGCFSFVNPAAELIFSAKRGFLIGRRLLDYIDPAAVNKIRMVAEHFISGEKKSFEMDLVLSETQRVSALLTATPKFDENGIFTGAFIIIRDITERKMIENALRQSEEKFRTVAECVLSAIFIVDHCKILYVNPYSQYLTGYKKEELLGREFTDIVALEFSTAMTKLILEANGSNNSISRHEIRIISKSQGEKWLDISIAQYEYEKQSAKLITAFDITERKKMNEELIKAKERAERSERLKSEFLAQMSHEIRTPVNAILSFTSLLREELESKVNEDLRSSFTIIDNGGRRLIRTIDMILNMSQIQTGSYEVSLQEMDIAKDVLDGLIKEFSNPAETKGLTLCFENNARNTTIIGDNYTVTQIFQNLLDNAIKYTMKGKVEVRLSNPEPHIMAVEVADTGIGISDGYFPKLFEPFSQEDTGYSRRFEGNGLGLSLVKKYAELNNAEIKVQTRQGKGTSFTVLFYI